jgi:hypothetical protein
MDDLRLEMEWLSTGESEAVLRETTGFLSIHAGSACLTRHEDTWSRTVRNGVLVSAYPLALWLASSWWRLNYEPLPATGKPPNVGWRMAHELASAGHGYVWPQVLFAPDGDTVSIWANQAHSPGQSVSYLCSLAEPYVVPASKFQWRVEAFIDEVMQRLRGVHGGASELASLWALVQEDMSLREMKAQRMLEAQLGYEPEDCPDSLIHHALRLRGQTGPAAMAELAPLYGQAAGGGDLSELEHLKSTRGLQCQPQVPQVSVTAPRAPAAPWQQGVEAAKTLLAHLHLQQAPVQTTQLLELLGVSKTVADGFQATGRPKAAVARPGPRDQIDFVPRKQHTVARRFEYARLVGELAMGGPPTSGWLVESDLQTATQKRQRAFAAALLCPIAALVGFLDDDFSDTALEAAAQHFEVSDWTVAFQLMNNGYRLGPDRTGGAPHMLTN